MKRWMWNAMRAHFGVLGVVGLYRGYHAVPLSNVYQVDMCDAETMKKKIEQYDRDTLVSERVMRGCLNGLMYMVLFPITYWKLAIRTEIHLRRLKPSSYWYPLAYEELPGYYLYPKEIPYCHHVNNAHFSTINRIWKKEILTKGGGILVNT